MSKYYLFILLFCQNILFAQSNATDPASLDSILSTEDIVQQAPNEISYSEGESESADASDEEFAVEEEINEEEPLVDRKIDAAQWDKLKKDKRFVYTKEKPEPIKPQKKSWDPDFSFLNGTLFKFLLYVFLALFLLYVVYLFFKNNSFSFKSSKRDFTPTNETPWEEIESFNEWDKALADAETATDYRLASRILYLQTLQKLNQGSVISYQQDKTNWHYVQQLFKTSYHQPFKELTTYFDYIWYGQYGIDSEKYLSLKQSFLQFHKMILV